ncbi:kinesin [Thraustotheca clavata]|uniref:Kinesin n=1 Tax=Thraustotheca clavata TaxID=74557 RepID=A0A1V9ZXS2_9STRA|nr:kinesin [Thraustotheca clavata]
MPPPSKADESVRVMVRIRPMSSKEKQDGRLEATVASFERAEVTITNPAAASSEAPKAFTFDAAFGSKSTQQQVYDTAATAIVEAVMDGYNGTIFAYGQTGAGKSHTMEGLPDPPEMRGIIPNSFKHIFDKVAITKKKQILVRASYLEIYNEEIRDLLSKDPKAGLDLKENADSGVFVKGLTAQVVKDAAEIDAVMRQGNKNRSVGATNMNQTSSRSHSIFTIVVECLSDGMDGKDHVCVGKLNLVDLAGSERQSKTGATGDRLQEANKINLSLSALGNVISALVDGKSKHIPYRDSKLTRLLQDSLGGNTKTVMIANCGPADYNYEETLTTLRYASRAKQIKNKPKINEDPKDAMIREFQEEIEALKAKLAAISSGAPSTVLVDGQAVPVNAAPVEIVEVEKVVEKVIIEKGISEEEAKRIAEKAKQEIGAVRKKAQDELSAAAKDNALAEHQKREMELKLENERKQHEEMEKQQKNLVLKLQSMEAKLLVGSEILNKAAQQGQKYLNRPEIHVSIEDELRKKKLELEERKHQELKLARELAEREESNLMKEEQYQSLQEEAEAKTKKLKKVFNKVKEVLADIKQMEKAHAREREDLLDTIRELTASLKLKSLVLEYFMPREAATLLESAATWDDEEDNFRLPHLELSGNSLRPRQRPASASGLRRPETASEKSRKKYVSEDEVPEMEIQIERNQYLVYTSDEEGDGYALAEDKIITNPPPTKDRPKTSKKSSRKSKDASSTSAANKCSICYFHIIAMFLSFVKDAALAGGILSLSALVGFGRRRILYNSQLRWALTISAALVALAFYMFLRTDSGTLAALLFIFLSIIGFSVGDGCVAIGLTGGISTGKSTVSTRLRERGAVVIDADAIARAVVEPGQAAHRAIVAAFGQEVLNEDRTINRAKLGSIIFADLSKRKVLNGCTHKYILRDMFLQLLYQRIVKRKKLVVFDAPLLFETNILEYFCSPIIVVVCSQENQLKRLMARDNLPKDKAMERINSQMKLADKAAKANIVLENDGAKEDLVRNVDSTLRSLERLL